MKYYLKKFNKHLIFGLLLTLLFIGGVQAQTTGKISGIVLDDATGEPLPGANINLVGTSRGAAADIEGRFFILNISPGFYNLRIDMMGYSPVIVENMAISMNRTVPVEIRMVPSVIEGEVVVVEVDRAAAKKDQTGTIKNISSEQLEILPVENLGAVVSMQAGVVEGHFRGGRSTEVSYLIDGIPVDETFGGQYASVEIEPESIKDLEVITGTFNAEYGRAMSGVVNAVTKDGDKEFHGSVYVGRSNYYTSNTDIFPGIDSSAVNLNEDYKIQLSGPILGDRITFFLNGRMQNNRNHLNGIHRYNVDDYSNYFGDTPASWITSNTGSGEYVPMNGSENTSGLGKIVFKLFEGIKFSLMHSINNDRWDGYSHSWKYNPHGLASSYRESAFSVFQLNHMLSNQLFYEFKVSKMETYNGNYLFRDTADSGYVNDTFTNDYGPGFFTGGQNKDHSERWMTDLVTKFDMTWQANNHHSLKAGVNYVQHDLTNEWHQIRNKYDGTPLAVFMYEPVIFSDSSVYADVYTVKPEDFAVYFQDKMEYDEMVINFGLRYDWFDPATEYPSDLRNPANQLNFEDDSTRTSTLLPSPVSSQISPRIGLAYQLGSAAILHFSYGHFFQLPPMYAMYQNHSFLVSPSDYSTVMGNSRLDAEKTVAYEIGLWQELMPGIGLEVSLFYKDIYNLLSTRIISTYNQIEYGLYSNKDYGNVRGLEVKFDVFKKPINLWLNYTLQYTRGNADSPTQAFDRAGNSQDPVNKFIPMSWDQRHTLNGTLGYIGKNFGVSLTGYFNSGAPYTFSPQGESILARVNLYPNNDYRPVRYHADLTGYYHLQLVGGIGLKFDLSIYNLFDRLNENWVNGETGRAYTAVVTEAELSNFKSDFSTYEETYQDPSAFSAPRQIKLGMGITF
ncbi:MAG: TonB-dependent receptor [Candidatus Marinimicrobia bacterium]|nr:TonB-dependent receptor [Candidatus Neomarinimicrobiota bacterium]MCF7850399.1 TonB-dependent receptor [Candidatus Neomarinimicrobiota bacterium]MCF7904992.1 TonB-dependent receptor [Candidatus Neomarinimicrobiota bacterium]